MADATPTELISRRTPAGGDRKLQLRLWLRLLGCARLIETEIRRRLRSDFDTTLARFDVLAQLEAARGKLAMGELSARLMVTNGNVTGLIAGMEADGLVCREPHPKDGRSTLIASTLSGAALFRSMAPQHEAWIGELTSGLSPRDRRELMVLLDKLKQSLREKLGA
jgi:DNA-binding MarR family transcriptional regulator